MLAEQEKQARDGTPATHLNRIDLHGYLSQRFPSEQQAASMSDKLGVLCDRMQCLEKGEFGCGNHQTDMAMLKRIHKKLKKVRLWGQSSSDKGDGASSRKKKRDKDKEGQESNKRVKAE